MLRGVYQEHGIRFRHHCRAEPPRDLEPSGVVRTVRGRDRASTRMSQPTVSKHLRVLRDAGFVESTVDAQRRLYRLNPEPLEEVAVWLAQFRRFWSAHVDALERHLDRMEQSTLTKSTATKRKTSTRRRGPNREPNKGEKE